MAYALPAVIQIADGQVEVEVETTVTICDTTVSATYAATKATGSYSPLPYSYYQALVTLSAATYAGIPVSDIPGATDPDALRSVCKLQASPVMDHTKVLLQLSQVLSPTLPK